MAEAGIPLPNQWHRISYFHCSLFGYFLGLLTATVSSEVSLLLVIFEIITVNTFWIITYYKKIYISIFIYLYRCSKLHSQPYCTWYHSHCYLCFLWHIWKEIWIPCGTNPSHRIITSNYPNIKQFRNESHTYILSFYIKIQIIWIQNINKIHSDLNDSIKNLYFYSKKLKPW